MLGFLDNFFLQLEGKLEATTNAEKPGKTKQGLGSLIYSLFVSKEYQNRGLEGWRDDKEKFKIDLLNDIKDFLFTKWEKPWIPGLIFDEKNKVISGFRNIHGRVFKESGNVLGLERNKGESPYFITKNKVVALGAKVLDASKYTSIISYIPIFKDRDRTEGKPDYMLPKFHSVINVDFVEGIKKPVFKVTEFKDLELNEYVENFLAEIKKRKRIPELIYDQADRAYYTHSLLGWSGDSIHLAPVKQFKNIEGYYSVLFHEITHSTMNPNRLGRGKNNTEKDLAYANEELVAEMGAMIICSELGLQYNRQNSLSYLKGWISRTGKSSDDALIEAYAYACDAAEYLLAGIDLAAMVPDTMTKRAELSTPKPVTAKPDSKNRIPNNGGETKPKKEPKSKAKKETKKEEPKPADGRNTASLLDFEGEVYDKMEEIGELTRSDAQGIAMPYEAFIKDQHKKGASVIDTAKEILKRSLSTDKPEPKFKVGQAVLYWSIDENKWIKDTIKSRKFIKGDNFNDFESGWRYHLPIFGDYMLSEKNIKPAYESQEQETEKTAPKFKIGDKVSRSISNTSRREVGRVQEIIFEKESSGWFGHKAEHYYRLRGEASFIAEHAFTLEEEAPKDYKTPDILPKTDPKELDYELARRAHMGTSFDPEKRAKSHQAEFANSLNAYAEDFEDLAKTDEQKELIKAEFARFKEGYKSKYTAWLHAKSRCISSMITGGSNFPVRRAEKANQAEQNRSNELTEFESKAEKAIKNKIKGLTPQEAKDAEAWRGVEREVIGKLAALIQINKGEGKGMSKPLFVSLLKGFIERLHKNRQYTHVNKSLVLVREVQEKYNFVVFSPKNSVWQLENTHPEEVVKPTGSEEIYTANGCKVENNRNDERVRIFMDEKPNSEQITYLKKHAFKWSPSNKAWQRQNTQNGINEALRFAKQFYPSNEPTPEPEKPKAKQSDKVEVIDFPIKDIYTDEKRFQNRKNAFSEDSKKRILKAFDDETFEWSKFDPITIWKDPKNSKYYVLSGHSRFAAFKEKNREGFIYDGYGFANIPSKIFKGTEAQAIDLALNSNTLSTKETDVERAMYYNRQRETCELKKLSGLGAKSDCEKEVESACREAEGKNANFILNLSYLNPEGNLIDTLSRLGAEKDNDSTNVLRTVANWIGEARRNNPAITNEQEAEIAKFLLNGGYGNKTGQFRNKAQFNERLDYSFNKWKARGAKPGDALNLANTLSKSPFEKDFDERVSKAKADYDAAIADHEEKHRKYLILVMNGELKQQRMDELMKPIVGWVERAKKEYERVRGQKDEVKKASEAQASLFGLGKITDIRKAKTKPIGGEIGKFLGEYERNNYSIILRGDKGAGKSRLLYQLVNAFAGKNLKCALMSLEMAKDSSVSTNYRDAYISLKNMENVHISDERVNYEQLNEICKHYDVVAIDSWTKLTLVQQSDFDRLQKENPNTILITIFQSTSGKVTRGGNMPEFDGAIVIHVHEGGIAKCEKNRYSAIDVEYNVFDKKVIKAVQENE